MTVKIFKNKKVYQVFTSVTVVRYTSGKLHIEATTTRDSGTGYLQTWDVPTEDGFTVQ